MTRPFIDALLRAIARNIGGAREVAAVLRESPWILPRNVEIANRTADLLEGAAIFVEAVALYHIRERNAEVSLRSRDRRI